jgi:hypothetical protein
MLAEIQWNAWQVIVCVAVVAFFLMGMEHGWPWKRK